LELLYGYSEIGQRFYALKSGKRTERVSWIAALQAGDLFAPMTFVGTCNRDLQHFSTICSTVTAIGEPVAKMLRIH
jgi:hypothetical protein